MEKAAADSFMRTQAERLRKAAEDCKDPELQKHLLEMAQDWLRRSEVANDP